jgi:hypothetical protein
VKFEIEFRSTPEEFSEVARQVRRLLYGVRLQRFLTTSVIVIAISTFLIFNETSPVWAAFLAGWVICYLATWLCGYWRYHTTLIESWKQHANTWGNHHALITDDGIMLRTAEVDTNYRWITFKAQTQSQNYLILWQDGLGLLALPWRALSAEQVSELKHFLDDLKISEK